MEPNNIDGGRLVAIMGLIMAAASEIQNFIEAEGLSNPRGKALLKLQLFLFALVMILKVDLRIDLTIVPDLIRGLLNIARINKQNK